MNSLTLVSIRFRNGWSNYSWFVRGLTPGGSLYGDIVDRDRREIRTFSASMDLIKGTRILDAIADVCKTRKSDVEENEAVSAISICFSETKTFFRDNFSIRNQISDTLSQILKEIEHEIIRGLIMEPSDNWDLRLDFARDA